MSWKRFFKIFILTAAALVAAAAMIVLLLAHSGTINIDAALRRRSASRSASERTESFAVRFGEHCAAACGDRTLMIASGNGAVLYDENGNTIASVKTSLASPAAHSSGAFFVAYDAGGTDLCVLSDEKYLFRAQTDGMILSASVNAHGWLAVCSTEDRYRGAVTAYNDSGDAVYKLYSAEGFPISAQISPKGYGLAVLRADNSGSTVDFYDMREEGRKASFSAENNVLADLAYIGEDRLLAIGSSILYIIDTSGNQIGSVEFGRNALVAYSFSPKYATVATSSSDYGESVSVMTVDSDCRVIASMDIGSGDVRLSQCGNYLTILSGEELAIYNKRLELCDSFDAAGRGGIVWMRMDGSPAVIGKNSVFSFG